MRAREAAKAGQPGFFDTDERLRALSAAGNPVKRLSAVVDFKLFRPELEAALARGDRSRGGRPPYDAVLMFRVLMPQALYTLSDNQTEHQLRDHLSFMRFAGLGLHEAVPDARTVWLCRERLTRTGALTRAFERFDASLRERGYLVTGGQIVDATVVEARRPRLSKDEKQAVREGNIPAGWSKTRTRQIGRAHGFIRRFAVTHAARHDGGQPGAVLDAGDTPAACGPILPIAAKPT